jgi:hypothetical protein
LNENIKSSEILNTSKYTIFRNDRIKGRGGGVLLAVKSRPNPIRLAHLEGKAEVFWCTLNIDVSKLLIDSAYRTTSYSDVDNTLLLDSLRLASLESDRYDTCLLAGDFNLRIKWTQDAARTRDQVTNNFLTLFYEFVPFQMVDTLKSINHLKSYSYCGRSILFIRSSTV